MDVIVALGQLGVALRGIRTKLECGIFCGIYIYIFLAGSYVFFGVWSFFLQYIVEWVSRSADLVASSTQLTCLIVLTIVF